MLLRSTLAMLAAPFIAGVVLFNAPVPVPASDAPIDSLRSDTATFALDLDKSIEIEIPAGAYLTPVPFTTSDGRSGWGVRIPGGRPIATPAYADGMIFVGGGYGSYEFYAFDAATGKLVWQIRTADDGPSAAVVEDGYVAFNTESCTVIVVEARTGKLVWQEWLGDPLMSQPAIADGRLYIAYPKSRGGHRGNESHHMLCADLRTGKHLWDQPIAAEVISAPVVDSGRVYFTCFDGTSYSLDAVSGDVIWTRENAGTSAPIIADGRVVMTQKEVRGDSTFEGVKLMNREGADFSSRMVVKSEAVYLRPNSGGGVAVNREKQAELDASVGFGGGLGSVPAAKLDKANAHVGVTTVVGGWAYQGSRAAYRTGRIMNAQGRYLNSVNAADGRVAWRAEAKGEGIDASAQIFSPPAVGNDYLYLSTSYGHIGSVRQSDGAVGFLYRTSHPAAFQPALAEGNMYVGTVDGMVICLKTGSMDADGWYAWGGNARHNK